MRATFAALLLLGAAAAALAFDCDQLQEPERTRCLDHAAEAHIGMAPVHSHVQEATNENPMDEADEDDTESVDDVMGDLGESSKTTAKVTERERVRAELKADMEIARRKAQGMFNDDVRVARAFSSLDDSMDALKSHLKQLHRKMDVRDHENEVISEYDREEDEERASQREELGESATIKGADTAEDSSNGVLDASAADLDKDLTVKFEHHTLPEATQNTEQRVEDLMKQLHSSMDDNTVSMLDEAESFLQMTASGDDVDDGMDSDMVMQDLSASGDSLVDRAQMEAKQSDSMEDEDEDQDEANDLGDVDNEEQTASKSLSDIDRVFADDPQLDVSDADDNDLKLPKASEKGEEEAEKVVEDDEDGKSNKLKESRDIGQMSQDNAVHKAQEFASSEDEKEEAEIKKMQRREKRMEENAKQQMYAEMKTMKDDVKSQEKQVERNMREHQRTESRVLGEDKSDDSPDN